MMNTVSELKLILNNIVTRHEVLANEFRILLLAILRIHGKTTWRQLKIDLEKILGAEPNPNTLAFHLKKLIKAGFVKRTMIAGEVFYEASIPGEIIGEIEPVVQVLRKILI